MHAALLSATLVFASTPEDGRAAEQQPTGPPTLSLGEASAPPGAPVVAPLTLSAPEGVRVGSVEVRLTYPKALLAFVKIEPSGLALGVGATVQADAKGGPDAQSSTLHVSISTPAGSRQPLPSGPLAYLGFTIDESAKAETSIALTHAAEALTTDDPPRLVKPLVAAPATISVSVPPVPACFFYMH